MQGPLYFVKLSQEGLHISFCQIPRCFTVPILADPRKSQSASGGVSGSCVLEQIVKQTSIWSRFGGSWLEDTYLREKVGQKHKRAEQNNGPAAQTWYCGSCNERCHGARLWTTLRLNSVVLRALPKGFQAFAKLSNEKTWHAKRSHGWGLLRQMVPSDNSDGRFRYVEFVC